MIQAQFRPIERWPDELRRDKDRRRSPFQASYNATLDLLDSELRALHARDIVIEINVDWAEIRNDGWPRASARPEHPGVIVSFDSEHGPLRYFTDVFLHWEGNLRAVALGLEALRKVDRYGITKRGEQYTGWSALPPGSIEAPAVMDLDQAIRFLHEHAPYPWDFDDPESVQAAYRHAAKKLHPDAGGDEASFKRLQQAIDVIGRAA